jgi:hypothetical protein
MFRKTIDKNVPLEVVQYLGVGVLVYLYVGLFANSIIDDAMITSLYAMNLKDYGMWGLFPGQTSNTATSPLNVVVMATFGFISNGMVQAICLMTTAIMLMLLLVLRRLSSLLFNSGFFGWLAFSVILFNPLLVSTIGMESPLYVLLVVFSLYLFLERRIFLLAVSLALLTMTRLDGGLFFLLMLAYLLFQSTVDNTGGNGAEEFAFPHRNSVQRAFFFLFFYSLCLLPWFLFSWIHLGSFVPETLFIKIAQSWGGLTIMNGWRPYWEHYPGAVYLTIIFLAGLITLPFVYKKKPEKEAICILLLFAFAYFAGYALLKVPPYHWYYVPGIISLLLASVLGVSGWLERRGDRVKKYVLQVLLVFCPAVGMICLLMGDERIHSGEALIHSNWASHQQYQEIGTWLGDNIASGDAVLLRGELGTMAFYSRLYLADFFSNGEHVAKILQRKTGLTALGTKINFCWWKPPLARKFQYELISYPNKITFIDDPLSVKQWKVHSNWINHSVLMLRRIK